MDQEIVMALGMLGLGLFVGLGLGLVLGRRLAHAGHTGHGQEPAKEAAGSAQEMAGKVAPSTPVSEAHSTAGRIGQPAQEAVMLASLAMATGDVERAQFILETFLKRHKNAIAEQQPWEMLFDIYHHRQDRARFEALAQSYRLALGLAPPDYTSWPHTEGQDLHRARPRLTQELAMRWADATAALSLLEAALAETGRPGRIPLSAQQTSELLFLRDCMAEMVHALQATDEKPQVRRAATPSFSSFSALEERYMRLAKEVVTLWPRPECRQFLESLIVDDRVSRQGFAEDVLAELVFLRQILDELGGITT